ncbi:phage portal protein [Novosphingobium aquae]|uniref:Phage portal protein n=1 Tax=Novosphingobium aquae TaxID=3133435 RepID=A0ABU8SBX2_9SPHN
MPQLFKSLFKTKSIASPIVTFSSGFENATDIHNLNSYKDSLYLYIGVSMIAKRVSGIPLELYKIKNKKGDVAEVFEHPLLSLLAKPNALQTPREFMELSATHYILAGEVFWLLDRNGASINAMSILRPDYVQVVLSQDRKTVVGYEYTNGTIYRFKPEDIIHISNIDPSNPLRGVGVVQPATSRILTEIEATKYQASFFKNQGRPDFAVFADQDVSEEGAADFRARWKRIFGRNQGGNVAIFGSQVKSVQELNKTPKEMDFIATQKFLRQDILSALHIPEEMVASEGSNRATSKEAYKMYLQEAVIPVLEALVDGMNAKLVPQVDQAVFIHFDDPTPVDRDLLLKETTELKKNGIITANEARSMYNYDAMEGADTLSAVPAQPAQTDPALQDQAKNYIRKRPILALKLQAIEDVVAALQATEPKRQMNSIFPNQKAKDAYAKAVNDNIDRKAEKVKDTLDDFHAGMLKRILATDLDVHSFMDVQTEKKAAKDLFTPIMVKLYKEGGQSALDALFKKASADHFFVDQVLLTAIEGRVNFFTNSIIDTTFEVLKSKIVDGIKEGHSIEKIGQSLRDYFDDMSVKRARTIAQTETNFVLSKATNDAYAQSSVVTGKEWLTVGDDKVRPEHEDNNGAIVSKGEAFPNGEHYPAEASVNCRCVLLPTV